MEKFKITFYPSKKCVEAGRDETILSAAISAGVRINSSCGGEGTCGRCRVILKSGETAAKAQTGILSPEERNRGVCLACLTLARGDLEVEVPPDAGEDAVNLVYAAAENVESDGSNEIGNFFARSPLAKKIYLELPPPTLHDKTSDRERLERQLRRVIGEAGLPAAKKTTTNLSTIRLLGDMLRSADWKVTVTLGKKGEITEKLLIEPGNTAESNYGACIDIGTTTLSVQLVNLNTGGILGTKAAYNRQANFGSDVITRIIYADKEGGLGKLHRAVIEEMDRMTDELIQEHHVPTSHVNYFVVAGNTTMIHLLMRVNPRYIRRAPYLSIENFFPVVRAHDEDLKVNTHALLFCVPGVSSYVGGDVTAGVLSSGLYREEETCVLIDIGTNGEIVLGNRHFLIAAAASAGPAFEGSGVKCGMRASAGALQRVAIDPLTGEISFETIGNSEPRGICGSGYIDLLAQMLKSGVLDKDGKLKDSGNRRVRTGEAGKEYVVVFKGEFGCESDIVITESDIENLKRAKAAIYSAAASLARHVGLDFSAIHKIFIAGGFGTCLDISSAVEIGLLPDLERDKFIFIGNSSLAGAREILLSEEALHAGEEIARKITYFELSVEPGYMDEYVAALFFPHTDLSKFPTVKYN